MGQFAAADRVFSALFLREPQDPSAPVPGLEEVFGPNVQGLDPARKLRRSEVRAWLALDRQQAESEHRSAERVWESWGFVSDSLTQVRRTWKILSFTDPPGAPATAEYVRQIWEGTFENSGPIRFHTMTRDAKPFYTATPLPLDAAGAAAFLEELCSALSSGQRPALEVLFNPLLLPERDSRSPSPHARPREDILSLLQPDRARWAACTFSVISPGPAPRHLPGARWEVHPTIQQQGRRPGATAPEKPSTFTWTLDLACIDGRWRIVGLLAE